MVVVFAMAAVRTHVSVLSELRGGGRTCPTLAKNALISGTDHWDATDVQVGALKKNELDGVAAMWTSVFEDISGDDDSPVVGGQLARFLLWVGAAVDEAEATDPEDEDEGEDGIRDDPEVGEDEASTALTPPKTPKKSTRKNKKAAGVRSAEVQSVLSAQRAENEGQIGYLNACLFLGQHTSRAECRGLGVGDLASSSELIRKSIKFGKSTGTRTLVDAIADAKDQRSLVAMDHFFDRLQASLSSVSDDHARFAPVALGLTSQLYSRAKSVAHPEFAVVHYIEDYVFRTHRGQGIPMALDSEALRRAEKLSLSEALAAGGGGARRPGGAEPTASEGTQSAMAAQIAEIAVSLERMGGVESKLEALSRRVDSRMDAMSAKVNRVASGQEDDDDKDKYMTCGKCSEKGHRAKNCPNK